MKSLFSLGIFTLFGWVNLYASDTTQIYLRPVKIGSKWGYANVGGQCAIPATFDSALDYSEGLAMVQLNKLWGFIDQKGKTIIGPRFKFGESFSCGLAKVWLNNPHSTIAFINKSGRIVFKCKYREVTSFAFGRARVFIHKRVCYLNSVGKVIIKTSFAYGGAFYEGIAQVWSDSTAEFIDTSGKRIAFFYEMGHSDFNEGWASVLGNGKPFYLNSAGQKIKIEHRSFYIDKQGNPTLTNTIDSLVYFSFSEGMAEVCVPGTDHKSGFIDTTGRLIVPVIYDWVTPFYNGFSNGTRDGKHYLIDKKGNICLPGQ